MKNALLTCIAVLAACSTNAQTTLFQQNFDSGSPVSQYISSGSPNSNQFNGITGPSVAIVNGALQFDRPNNGSTGHFARNTDFSPTPSSLYIQMDFEVVSATTTAGNSALLFYVGNGFSNGPSITVSEVYARFGINFTGNGYEFSVRHVESISANSINSPVFAGRQTLTFVLNNTGYTVTYLQPGGGVQTLASDKYDMWVGSTQVFNEFPVQNPSQTMTEFKLRIDDDVYAAVFQFDNFLIRDINNALAVSVADFKAAPAGSRVELSWQVYKSAEASFVIERSFDALSFAPIGNVPATSFSDGQRTYVFSDSAPGIGSNYYRLRQTADDGSPVFSKIVAAIVHADVPELTILDNPTSGLAIYLKADNLPDATYRLSTLTGQHISCEQRKTPDGQVTLLLQHPLPSGVYLLTAITATTRITRRLLMH